MPMNCDRVQELLPWLLNGTLEAGERREALDHLRGCPGCRAALADTRVAWEIFDWHPQPAELIAYAGAGAGAAASGDAAAAGFDLGAVEEHVAGCPRCAAELELVRTSRMLADPAEDERIAILPARPQARRGELAAQAATRDDAAARRAWRRSALAASVVGLLAASGWFASARQSRDLERRLAAAGATAAATAPTAATASTAPTPSTASRSAASPAAAPTSRDAAADLRRRTAEAEAKLAALAGQNQQLQRQVAGLGRTAADLDRRAAAAGAAAASASADRQPAAAAPRIESDAWVGDLSPAGQAERGAGEPAPEVIPLSSGTATVLLHARLAESSGDYEIEIRDAQDRRVGRPIRVQPQPGGQGAAGEFGITLRRNALAPGAYTLHLLRLAAAPGGAEPARKELASYSVRIS
jgi:predicted anti-sigma-YlaC factor YlaD